MMHICVSVWGQLSSLLRAMAWCPRFDILLSGLTHFGTDTFWAPVRHTFWPWIDTFRPPIWHIPASGSIHLGPISTLFGPQFDAFWPQFEVLHISAHFDTLWPRLDTFWSWFDIFVPWFDTFRPPVRRILFDTFQPPFVTFRAQVRHISASGLAHFEPRLLLRISNTSSRGQCDDWNSTTYQQRRVQCQENWWHNPTWPVHQNPTPAQVKLQLHWCCSPRN